MQAVIDHAALGGGSGGDTVIIGSIILIVPTVMDMCNEPLLHVAVRRSRNPCVNKCIWEGGVEA